MTFKLHLWKNVLAMKIGLDLIHRHSEDFSKGGGVTLCQSEGTRLFGNFQAETSWHFLPPVLGYLVKKGVQRGGSRAPQDPPGYVLDLIASKHLGLQISLIQ